MGALSRNTAPTLQESVESPPPTPPMSPQTLPRMEVDSNFEGGTLGDDFSDDEEDLVEHEDDLDGPADYISELVLVVPSTIKDNDPLALLAPLLDANLKRRRGALPVPSGSDVHPWRNEFNIAFVRQGETDLSIKSEQSKPT